MNKIDIILKSLYFDIEENISNVRSKITFYIWLTDQFKILLTIYNDPNIQDLIDITNKEREKLEQRILNLSKVEIKLFERGGDVKSSIGIGFGDFASEFKNGYVKNVLNKAHSLLDSFGLKEYVDKYISRSLAWQGVYEVLLGAKSRGTYKIEEDDFLWANDYPDEMIGIRYSSNLPF